MWASRSERFPEETPSTREYYLLRSIFEEHFPSKCALDTVPKVIAATDMRCVAADLTHCCVTLLLHTLVISADRKAHNTKHGQNTWVQYVVSMNIERALVAELAFSQHRTVDQNAH